MQASGEDSGADCRVESVDFAFFLQRCLGPRDRQVALETEFCLVLERIVGLILVRIRLCRVLGRIRE